MLVPAEAISIANSSSAFFCWWWTASHNTASLGFFNGRKKCHKQRNNCFIYNIVSVHLRLIKQVCLHFLHLLYFYYLLLSKLLERHVFHKSARSLVPKKDVINMLSMNCSYEAQLQSKQVKRSSHKWINNLIIAYLISGIISIIWLLDEWSMQNSNQAWVQNSNFYWITAHFWCQSGVKIWQV